MPIFISLILGVIEGLTEYLPVSSTGHLIVAERALGLGKSEASDAFAIVVQFGAILAVAVQYRALLLGLARGLAERRPDSLRLLGALAIGFVPVAVIGKLAGKAIKSHLFGTTPVAIALIAGGLIMIVSERVRAARKITGRDGLEHVTAKRALIIGAGQCFALVPGTSRSMATILAGQLAGLSTRTAAEFSFLLGLPTLGAATLYEAWKSRHVLLHDIGAESLALGVTVSFLVAWAVIAAFVRYLTRRGLEPFGVYRVAMGALVLWMTLR